MFRQGKHLFGVRIIAEESGSNFAECQVRSFTDTVADLLVNQLQTVVCHCNRFQYHQILTEYTSEILFVA